MHRQQHPHQLCFVYRVGGRRAQPVVQDAGTSVPWQIHDRRGTYSPLVFEPVVVDANGVMPRPPCVVFDRSVTVLDDVGAVCWSPLRMETSRLDAFGVAVVEIGAVGVEKFANRGAVSFDQAAACLADVRCEGVGLRERTESDGDAVAEAVYEQVEREHISMRPHWV